MYLGHGLDLSRSRDVIGHVAVRLLIPIGVPLVLTISKRFWNI